MNNDEQFDVRNKKKKSLDKSKRKVFFKERDVFFMNMWKNIWSEQNGKWNQYARPIVIIRKFNNSMFWGLALSTVEKIWAYYESFYLWNQKQTIILSQLRCYSNKRLLDKIWMVNNEDFFRIKEKIRQLL